jgi:predicted GNAT superfamily acetyltransferase
MDAAGRARVTIRAPQADDDLRSLIAVGERLWGSGGSPAANELRALQHAGAVLLAAYDAQADPATPVGFLIGFLGWRHGLHVHSHQTGVLPSHQRRGVGYALKLTQRATCLAHGITEVRWTFDPLILRNAAFNLRRLGAVAASFMPDFYGRMEDSINSGDLSDRLEAVWTLTAPLPAAVPSAAVLPAGVLPAGVPSAGVPSVAPPAAMSPGVGAESPAGSGGGRSLLVDRDGWPQEADDPPAVGSHLAVPADFEAVRRADPDRARAWRLAVRRALLATYASGLRVAQVDAGGYTLGPAAS